MGESVAAAPGWDFFQRVYCITTAHRRDRQEMARRQFDQMGLGSRVEFVVAARHPDNVEQGIYQSHQRCMQKGLAAGVRNMLIFEDDILFSRFEAQNLADAVAFLGSGEKWDIFFLGCLVRGLGATSHAHVRRVDYRCLAHAYAVQEAFARRLVQRPWQGIPFDTDLRRLQGEYYSLYPAVAFQSNAATDNSAHRQLARFRQLLGGLQRIQRANQFYYSHRPLIIALHIMAGILMLYYIAR